MTAGRKKTDKRGKGRPTASQVGVGREALISAARALLQEFPPAQVTSTAIARRANADPALVRYYFGTRENLLFEVANQIGAETNRLPPDEGDPVELLAEEEMRLSGKRAANPGCAQVPELRIPTRIDNAKRDDVPKVPPQPRDEVDVGEGGHDLRSDPSRDVARELGDDEAILGAANVSWDFAAGTAAEDDDEGDDD